VADIDPAVLRPVVDLAITLAKVDRPASSSAAELVRLGAKPRWTANDLRRACELLADSPELRARVRAASTPAGVGADAYAWLEDPSPSVRSDRQRQGAQLRGDRAADERAQWRRDQERFERRIGELEAIREQARGETEQWRKRASDATARAERLQVSLEAVRSELTRQQAAWQQAREHQAGELAEMAALRDGLIEQRAELEERLAELAGEVEAARRGRSVPRATPPIRRTPLGVPGGLSSDSVAAARHLLERVDVMVLIDGYNASLDPWTTAADLWQRREVLLLAVEGFVTRRGARVLVVFDGAEASAGPGRRRTVRVRFSESGVKADDVMCDEAERLPPSTPVVAVTDDQALVYRLRRLGVNTISVAQLWAVLRG